MSRGGKSNPSPTRGTVSVRLCLYLVLPALFSVAGPGKEKPGLARYIPYCEGNLDEVNLLYLSDMLPLSALRPVVCGFHCCWLDSLRQRGRFWNPLAWLPRSVDVGGLSLWLSELPGGGKFRDVFPIRGNPDSPPRYQNCGKAVGMYQIGIPSCSLLSIYNPGDSACLFALVTNRTSVSLPPRERAPLAIGVLVNAHEAAIGVRRVVRRRDHMAVLYRL